MSSYHFSAPQTHAQDNLSQRFTLTDWENLYTLHRHTFVKWACKDKHLSTEQAVNIYQDTFLVLYENITDSRYECLPGSLKAHIYDIATNLIRNHLKNKGCEKEQYPDFPADMRAPEPLAYDQLKHSGLRVMAFMQMWFL